MEKTKIKLRGEKQKHSKSKPEYSHIKLNHNYLNISIKKQIARLDEKTKPNYMLLVNQTTFYKKPINNINMFSLNTMI